MMGKKYPKTIVVIAMVMIISILLFLVLAAVKPVLGQYYPFTNVTIVKDAQIPSNEQFYNPSELTVNPGAAVIWKNEDTVVHTATSGRGIAFDSKFDTDIIAIGKFSQPIMMPLESGQYPYFCTLHPWMTGTVLVI
jgi:plastocyanin